MTESQMNMVLDLHRCTFLPGSFEKRFVKSLFNSMARIENKPLTEKQSRYLAQTFHKYRKQIGIQDHNLHCQLCNDAVEKVEKK